MTSPIDYAWLVLKEELPDLFDPSLDTQELPDLFDPSLDTQAEPEAQSSQILPPSATFGQDLRALGAIPASKLVDLTRWAGKQGGVAAQNMRANPAPQRQMTSFGSTTK